MRPCGALLDSPRIEAFWRLCGDSGDPAAAPPAPQSPPAPSHHPRPVTARPAPVSVAGTSPVTGASPGTALPGDRESAGDGSGARRTGRTPRLDRYS